ncbi:MAG: 4'-phosphopantetheinyl transferase superfamily protein, partial [Rhodothermales bacterium]|nr:4'-phosphopantetheinyl transferase superfamily protein [Rhodothermales bacterium]
AVDAVEYTVSHGGGLALYAVARSRRVGVDVEPVRVIADADGLVDRFFSVGEGAAYRALPAADRPAAFAACWTRKEAFVKALGDGLSYPLDAFDVTVGPDRPAALLRLGGDPAAAARWRLRALPVGAGYAATVAAEAPPCHLLCLDASARARREPTALPLPT